MADKEVLNQLSGRLSDIDDMLEGMFSGASLPMRDRLGEVRRALGRAHLQCSEEIQAWEATR